MSRPGNEPKTPAVPSQAPEKTLFQRVLGPLHVTGIFWYKFHQRGMALIPRWSIRPLLGLFTTFFFLVLRRIRAAIASNLEIALGPCSWWERQRRIYRTMRNLAWSLTERYERLNGMREPEITIAGREHWEEVLASGAGFVIVTAHIGNWETALFDPQASHDRHLHVVREQEHNPDAQELIRSLIEEVAGDQVTVHFAESDDIGLASRLLVALRRGDLVAVQGDRPRTGGRSVRARIFEQEIELPGGPAALCRAAGTKMLPVFSFRSGRLSTEVVVRPPIAVERSTKGAADLQITMQRVASEIEWAIRRDPYQWFCFRELWPDRRA